MWSQSGPNYVILYRLIEYNMISPSKILSLKNRIIFYILIRIIRIDHDTFVYICRDVKVPVGEVPFLIEYYYSKNPADSKRIAFKSSAWGKHGVDMIRDSDAAFDYLASENNEK